MLSRFSLAVLAAAFLFAMPAPASAEWRRAESDRFVVYSNSRESVLRDYVQKLETFDWILRHRLGLPQNQLPARKLPVYLLESPREFTQVFPTRENGVVAAYVATEEDIFATAIRSRGDDMTLHEYAHHFMYQNAPAAYPAWLVEGFAEYMMTARINDREVEIGGFNANRIAWLIYSDWIPIGELLSKQPHEVRSGAHEDTYYPVAWLLTHWFMSDTERSRQLQTYIAAVGNGVDPVEAMQTATGLAPFQLRRILTDYMKERLRIVRYISDFPRAEMTVTTLPASADDLLLIGQRLNYGVRADRVESTVAEVRRLAARHPDDPFALLQLGHAELHFGDPVAGEAVLTRLLEREPANVEALQLMASRYIQMAHEANDSDALMRRARGYLSRAFAADDANYTTFILLGRTREGAADYPTENDLATWALAYTIAPQLSSARLGYASALMQVARFDEATILLRPLANAPHGGQTAAVAQRLLARAQAHRPPLTSAEIQAAVDADEVAPPQPTAAPADPAAPQDEPASPA